GRFRVATDDDGNLEIAARGHKTDEMTNAGGAPARRSADITVELPTDPNTGTLTIELSGPEGDRPPAVTAEGQHELVYGGPGWSEASQPGDERIRIEGIRSGSHWWKVYGDGIALESGNAVVPAGGEATARATLRRGGSVRVALTGEDGMTLAFAEATV